MNEKYQKVVDRFNNPNFRAQVGVRNETLVIGMTETNQWSIRYYRHKTSWMVHIVPNGMQEGPEALCKIEFGQDGVVISDCQDHILEHPIQRNTVKEIEISVAQRFGIGDETVAKDFLDEISKIAASIPPRSRT